MCAAVPSVAGDLPLSLFLSLVTAASLRQNSRDQKDRCGGWLPSGLHSDCLQRAALQHLVCTLTSFGR